MKCLTIIQPWAQLIAIGAKAIETRSYKTNYRGELAIHASKRFPEDCGFLCFEEPFTSALAEFFRVESGFRICRLPTGYILAVATLIDCLPVDQLPQAMLTEHERAFGNYGYGRYGWIMENVRRLQQPIQCKGALGLWPAPTEVEERLRHEN